MSHKTINSQSESELKNYIILCELGKGSSEISYKVKNENDGKIYVMKKIQMNEETQKTIPKIDILIKLNHENLIKYYNSFHIDDCLYIITEYAEKGDLNSLLKLNKMTRGVYSEDEIWHFAYQICLGLKHLNDNSLMHSIKLTNLFMNKHNILKICGLEQCKSTSEQKLSKIDTSFNKDDVWALGCSLYSLCSNKPIYKDLMDIEIATKDRIPGCYSNELCEFLTQLLIKNPENRLNIKSCIALIPKRIKEKIIITKSPLHKERIKVTFREDKNNTIKIIKTQPIIVKELSKPKEESPIHITINEIFSPPIVGWNTISRVASSPCILKRVNYNKPIIEKKIPKVDLKNIISIKTTPKNKILDKLKHNANRPLTSNLLISNPVFIDNNPSLYNSKNIKLSASSQNFFKRVNIEENKNFFNNKLLYINKEIDKDSKNENVKLIELINKFETMEDITPHCEEKKIENFTQQSNKFANLKTRFNQHSDKSSLVAGFCFKTMMTDLQSRCLTIKDIKGLSKLV